jgi:hypothetical protein
MRALSGSVSPFLVKEGLTNGAIVHKNNNKGKIRI